VRARLSFELEKKCVFRAALPGEPKHRTASEDRPQTALTPIRDSGLVTTFFNGTVTPLTTGYPCLYIPSRLGLNTGMK
jgi:hypothetical protein